MLQQYTLHALSGLFIEFFCFSSQYRVSYT